MNDQVLLKEIELLKKPTILCISGFGGSGKSTLAKQLSKLLNAPIVSIDSFYQSNISTSYEYWNVMDYKRLEMDVLIPFMEGKQTITFQTYNWENENEVMYSTIQANDYLIVEGVGLLRPELLKYYSYTIWIDCPIDLAIRRAKQRDNEQYNVNNDDLWEGIWKENDLQCFNEYNVLSIVDHLYKTNE